MVTKLWNTFQSNPSLVWAQYHSDGINNVLLRSCNLLYTIYDLTEEVCGIFLAIKVSKNNQKLMHLQLETNQLSSANAMRDS